MFCSYYLLIQFWGLRVSRNLFTSRLSSLLAYNYSKYSLTGFCISAVSVVISPLSFFFFCFLDPLPFLLGESGQICWYCLSFQKTNFGVFLLFVLDYSLFFIFYSLLLFYYLFFYSLLLFYSLFFIIIYYSLSLFPHDLWEF